MLSLDDFRPLELEDKSLFEEFYKKYPPQHSDFSFGNLYAWRHYTNYQLANTQGHLLILAHIDGSYQFSYPVGKHDVTLLKGILQLAVDIKASPLLELIHSEAQHYLKQHFPSLGLVPCRDCHDYVYQARSLAKLPGKNYLNHRNVINKFRRTYSYRTEEISGDNFKEVMEFLEGWCIWRDCEGNPALEAEKIALLTAMKHFDALELEGIVLRVDDDIQALSIYEPLNEDTAVVHYEKADVDYEGIYQVINQETAQRLQHRFRFINREHDLGVPGLRRAKQRYRPHHMVEVSQVERLPGDS